MKSLVLSAVMGLGLALAGLGWPQASAQYGYGHGHAHGHCHPGSYSTGYRGGYPGDYSTGYRGGFGPGFLPGGFAPDRYYGGYPDGYRSVPPVVLGQIQTGYPDYSPVPYGNNFGGFYSPGCSGMGYSNFGTGMGLGHGPSISIGIGGFRPRF